MDMDIDPSTLPNELALSVAEKCQKWTYAAYSEEYEVNSVPRNPTVDRQYDTRLERAITDTQTKVQSQKRVLDDVLMFHIYPNSSCEGNSRMKKRSCKLHFVI
jgi:hypothetical protein